MPSYTGYNTLQETQVEEFTYGADIFQTGEIEKSTFRRHERYYRPTSLSNAGPFDFHLPREGHLYLNPPSFRLNGKLRIKKLENGKLVPLDAKESAHGIVNLFPYSLFKSVEVDINGKRVGQIFSPNYMYKCFLESELSYGTDAKDTVLQTAGYASDTPAAYGKADGNEGWKQRQKRINASKVYDFSIDLHSDLTSTDKFWPDDIDVSMRFTRNPDEFSLFCNAGGQIVTTPAVGTTTPAVLGVATKETLPKYVIDFEELQLQVDKIEMQPQVLELHQRAFAADKFAIYPFKRSVMLIKQIPANSVYYNVTNAFLNEVPNNIIVGLVKSSAYNGTVTTNPFHFEHFNLNYFGVEANGRACPPGGLRPTFAGEKSVCMREYRRLFDNCGIGTGNITNNISYDKFVNGFTVFAEDFSSDRCIGYHTHEKEEGSLNLEFRFASPLTEAVTIIVFGAIDDQMFMDRHRNTYFKSNPTIV